MSSVKYPIGIQSFPSLREEGYLYVDKTEFVYKLITEGKYYFLSRPRRFGKSLLLSTIEALFQGRRDLFKGLAVDSLDWEWEAHPVLHLDLNRVNYSQEGKLYDMLYFHMKRWEETYGISSVETDPGLRFSQIIMKAAEVTGRKVVVLIDEYDKPLLDTLHDEGMNSTNRRQLQAFYSVLKSMDPYIRFAMLTGVTRFGKVSVFSGLNNLQDLSLDQDFNAVCGISESELSHYFVEGVGELAAREGVTLDEIHGLLKTNYDGYHFARAGEDIYNPFSLLNTFKKREFGSYWFSTGTPTFLVHLLERNRFPVPEMEGYRCGEATLTGSDIYLTDPIPIFYQSGYLTIKGYDREFREYILGYPNREVAEGFTGFLMKSYLGSAGARTDITKFVRDVREGKAEAFMKGLKSFFADIPYDHVRGDREVHFENVVYVLLKLMGFYVHTEYRTSDGRIDMVIETARYVYVMEFKLDGTPDEALRQIDEKDYTLPFRTKGKEIFRIGVVFGRDSRRLDSYCILSD